MSASSLVAPPIDLRRKLEQRGRLSSLSPVVKRRVQALIELLAAWESDVRDELADATPADIDAVALRLGRRGLPNFRFLVPLCQALLDDMSEHARAPTDGADRGWETFADDMDSVLPHLSPSARRDIRASVLLLAEVPRREPTTGLADERLEYELAFGLDTDTELRLLGLVQIIVVLGADPDCPHELAEAAALASWRLLRRGAPEDLVEDAYLAAEAYEADLAPDDDDAVSLASFLGTEGD
ncbi:hypothetical protein [Haliangium sp.]|uniref:hypothetical protein n=1 Tax=Haliangium sp. TaxID=2663208 RepID=UPI003D1004EE